MKGHPGSGVVDILQGRTVMDDYTNFGDISEHKVARYLRKQSPDWSYEHCGIYTIYYRPNPKDANKYETLAVLKHDNAKCTKEVFIPNDKKQAFERELK